MKPILVWLVTEYHCYKPIEGKHSVWISSSPLTSTKSLEEDVAAKLIGPIDAKEGERVVEVLRKHLEAIGITVVHSITADD